MFILNSPNFFTYFTYLIQLSFLLFFFLLVTCIIFLQIKLKMHKMYKSTFQHKNIHSSIKIILLSTNFKVLITMDVPLFGTFTNYLTTYTNYLYQQAIYFLYIYSFILFTIHSCIFLPFIIDILILQVM